jgi:transcription-repair coupling factor (superfamily II helicase)
VAAARPRFPFGSMDEHELNPDDSSPAAKARVGEAPSLGTLAELLARRDPPRSVLCTGMWGSSKAYYLEQIRRHTGRPLLVLCPSESEARALYHDVRFFQGGDSEPGAAASGAEDLELVEATAIAGDVVFLPAWGVRLHEQTSPPRDAVLGRITAYERLREPRPCIVIATVDSACARGLSREVFEHSSVALEHGAELDPAELTQRLVDSGYRSVDLVEAPGHFSRRGGIVDLFSPQYAFPIRVELFGDTIESLRFFEPGTQRSRNTLLEARALPCSEVPFRKEAVASAKGSIVASARELETPEDELVTLLDELDRRGHFPGVEWVLGHFYRPESVLEWMGPDAVLVLDAAAALRTRLEEWAAELDWERDNNRQLLRLPVDLDQLVVDPRFFVSEALPNVRLDLEVLRVESAAAADVRPVVDFGPRTLPPVRGRWEELFAEVRRLLRDRYAVHVVGPQPADLDHLRQMLHAHDIHEGPASGSGGGLTYERGNLTVGFLEPETRRVYFTIAEIYGKSRRHHRMAARQAHEYISSFRDLKPGDLIVHLDHGIGRYLGLRRLNIQGVQGDYLELQYEGTDKLYVPMTLIHLIQRYRAVADEEAPVHLDRLGTAAWSRVKERVKKAIRLMAGELLELYAARRLVEGIAYSPDGPEQFEFEARFEFDPTPDQQRTIDQVRSDMESPQPMDRLVCGDVGFGKTEVAMRAAHKATLDGFQVAVLVPTTILAQQHFNTFTRRFAGFDVRIEMLSRFVPAKKVKETLEGVKAGAVQILIGTHMLLSQKLDFARLGLLIVDEEHRFGVSHKEKIKRFKKRVDVLTLTATPIPRTLHMSLLQVRDLSVINTPPVDRLPVITRLATFSDEVVREAVEKELARGGQVFFIHNRVQSIEQLAARLRKLVPRAKVAVAHGQMDEKLLEQIMVDFVSRRYHVLCCTAIIESGMDIPQANTIIINRADHFGLAQLYQLRGRVGRSRRRAYCLLLTPPVQMLPAVAQERLRVIQELTELGSGFRLAAHDMEIRGAGNLLGGEQHGHIEAIGFDTYCQLLEQTIAEMKGEGLEDRPESAIKVDLDQFLPDDYVPDINQKLMIYRSLAAARALEEVADVEDSLLDRYGRPPPPAEALLDVARLKALCVLRRVEKLDLARGQAGLVFAEDARVSHRDVRRLMDELKGRLSFKAPFTLKLSGTDPKELAGLLRGLDS